MTMGFSVRFFSFGLQRDKRLCVWGELIKDTGRVVPCENVESNLYVMSVIHFHLLLGENKATEALTLDANCAFRFPLAY